MLSQSSHTLRNECRDFVEWHRGRAPYVLWAIDLDLPPVRARVAQAAQHLAPWLLPGYTREPHVTLDLCGFPASPPVAEDEFCPQVLAAACAQQAARFPRPFVIEIGALDSFSSAPFLHIADPAGGIAAARAALAQGRHHRSHNAYLPHLTVGLYAEAWPAARVLGEIARYQAPAPLRCAVERVSLLAYAPQEIGGRLRRVADFCLRSRQLLWHEDLRLNADKMPVF